MGGHFVPRIARSPLATLLRLHCAGPGSVPHEHSNSSTRRCSHAISSRSPLTRCSTAASTGDLNPDCSACTFVNCSAIHVLETFASRRASNIASKGARNALRCDALSVRLNTAGVCGTRMVEMGTEAGAGAGREDEAARLDRRVSRVGVGGTFFFVDMGGC